MISITMHFRILGIPKKNIIFEKLYLAYDAWQRFYTLKLVSLADSLKTFLSKRGCRSGFSLTAIIHIFITLMHLYLALI